MATTPTIRTVHADRYGPPEVLRIRRAPVPEPGPDEIRIRIHAAAVTASNIFIRSAHVTPVLQIPFGPMMGITRPRPPILGCVFSGIVDATGSRTTRLRPGDQVYGASGTSGTFAVQHAKALGARVTAVCSTANIGLVRHSEPTTSSTTPRPTPRHPEPATTSCRTPSAARRPRSSRQPACAHSRRPGDGSPSTTEFSS